MENSNDAVMETTTNDDAPTEASTTIAYDPAVVDAVLQACAAGNLSTVQSLIDQRGTLYASQQRDSDGTSPLIQAAVHGHEAVCAYLLQAGAPWNAVDRTQQCAGNYATANEHWATVNALVEWGTRSELILGMVERGKRSQPTASGGVNVPASSGTAPTMPVSHQPSTKPDYLRQRLEYSADGQSLLDADKDAVMMEWERPLMKAHAQILMEQTSPPIQSSAATPSSSSPLSTACYKKRVLNVGFGMGIIDTCLQQDWQPSHHIIIEAHPDVHRKMIRDGWDRRPNVRVCLGTWQTVLPQLIREGVVVDAVFYDTYGEHFLDLEDFHALMVRILAKQPGSVYSFFNGLAPDNLFFHGVACQCVKLQLAQLGLDADFFPCEIQVKDAVWEGIRRKYWHGRDTYYLPVCRWNAEFLQTGRAPAAQTALDTIAQECSKRKAGSETKQSSAGTESEMANYGTKRQQLS